MPKSERTFYLLSLGCPKNGVDSDGLATVLAREGWRSVHRPQDAEYLLVNTCSFITPAVEESLEAIMELADLREGGRRRLVVAGCLVSRYGKGSLAPLLPEVDLWIDLCDYPRFTAMVREWTSDEGSCSEGSLPRESASTLDRGYVYIKISEGCDRRCSYCTIPSIRGPLRSRPREDILKEARLFLGHGAREMILVAQDTTSYGLDLCGRRSLPALLHDLCEEPGEWWLRVMYAHPDGVDGELLGAMADTHVCRYLDLPFQHADAGVLRAMGRKGDALSHRRLLARIEESLGEVAVRATFMVGFPGEDEKAYRTLHDFIAAAHFDWLGLFSYSHEEGTPAFSQGKGALAAVARARNRELANMQEEIMRDKAQSLVGREMRVLVEGESDEVPGFWEGRSQREAPEIDGVVFIASAPGLKPGNLVDAVITSSEGIDLVGAVR